MTRRRSMRWRCSATLPRGDASLPIRQQAGAIAETVFARNPKHPGAAHYILHAYDHGTLGVEGAAGRARLREDRAGGEPRAAHARACVPAAGILGRGGRDRRGVVERVDRVGEAARPVDRESRLSQPVVAAIRMDAAGEILEDEGSDCFRGSRPCKTSGPRDRKTSSRPQHAGGHGYGEQSEIGRGSNEAALRNDRGSMRARYIIESERWQEMKGQTTFDNIEELFALGLERRQSWRCRARARR